MTFINLVPPIYYNVKQYGAVGDGVTDDTTAIANARSAANAAGGGTVYYPTGIFISGNQTLYSFVTDLGAGIGATTIKLKNGANTDLFSAQTSLINLSAAFGSGIVGNLGMFSMRNLTLDGNKANQSSGPSYPLRFYGYTFVLRDLEIKNGYSGGVQIDWSGTTPLLGDSMEASIEDIKVHDSNGIGFQMGGPHDSFLANIMSFAHSSHGFHFAPNAAGALCMNIHPFFLAQSVSAVGILCEAQGCSFMDCMVEGSDFIQFADIAQDTSLSGGEIFGNTGYAGVGLQLGQVAGGTPIPGQINQSAGAKTAVTASGCNINTKFNNCVNGAISCVNEGSNVINAAIFQTSGTALVSNPNGFSDTYNLNISGLTTDNTLGKSGGAAVQTHGGSSAFAVNDLVNGTVFHVDSNGNLFANGGFNTPLGYYFTASTTAASLATGGTISAQGLSDIAVAPTGAVTGVIMQAGFGGQFCVVCNASAFSITMAASGTSHVANGASCVIAANTALAFFYNGTTSLWYQA